MEKAVCTMFLFTNDVKGIVSEIKDLYSGKSVICTVVEKSIEDFVKGLHNRESISNLLDVLSKAHLCDACIVTEHCKGNCIELEHDLFIPVVCIQMQSEEVEVLNVSYM